MKSYGLKLLCPNSTQLLKLDDQEKCLSCMNVKNDEKVQTVRIVAGHIQELNIENCIVGLQKHQSYML